MKNTFFFAFIWVFCGVFQLSYAQNDLDKFYNSYKNQFLKDEKVKINTYDKVNGFISFCLSNYEENECYMGVPSYDLAMWVTTKGQRIFGVYQYACGGEGCWGDRFKDLRFYNSSMQDITKSIINIGEIEALAQDVVLKTFDGEILPTHLQRSPMVQIPRQGTTIKLIIGVMGVAEANFANLVFNLNTGKFTLVKN